MNNVRAHVLVSGIVQGVGFRQWTCNRAASLGLFGWVRNLPGGEVEAVVEGPERRVAEMIEAAHTGPGMARVEKVDISYGEYTGEFEEFSVRRK
jgi:acylphosphatase